MDFQEKVQQVIIEQAEEKIREFHEYHNFLHLDLTRKGERLGLKLRKTIKTPESWNSNRLFDPFYVRRRAGNIARSITKKIISGTYQPNPAYQRKVPKKGGGFRVISEYEIPDTAISRLFYKGLLGKNRHRFSSFSYAYRNDRNVHFAIQDIDVDIKQYTRLFIAEFDFSDFFGSISHDYLRNQFSRNGFLVSETDQKVIDAFLTSYGKKGIPQGTSISLFLANMVCWELDKKLERLGVKFARYADDTVIWTPDYSKACESFTLIEEFSRETGIRINASKSAGISLLAPKGMPTELASKSHFDFLGYSLSTDYVSIKESAVSKIKSNISYILFKHLIQPLNTSNLKSVKIPSNSKDESLLAAICEVRRYLYGNLTIAQIQDYLNGKTKRISFKGLMSYYPLINNTEQLKALDGWLVSAIHRAVQKRSKLLIKHNFNRQYMFPFNVKKKDIVATYRTQVIKRKPLLEVPSLSLLYAALKLAIFNHGIEKVMSAKSLEYY
ncbi:reverse transcriptase domain-containing protein [Pseudomonas sediminis]|uniref:RNA-dependent DNA polymerase n=1 Tax=Pseudomonas sediminis TaxID=1691904 RepID=A0A2G5FU86_9PSED|nr:reverse transcriptase domain-containing protein [Pseudomonas sediminis]PIA71557.1 RNA-dependent DNA polymerase [Pseudomonas sediminis]